MARVVDLTGENVTRQRRKERNFGTKTDLPSTSVERGNTHWTDGSNVNIDGFLGVAGTMTVSGVLSVTGTFNASGAINLSGSTSVTGPLDITGATTIGGSLDVTGPTNLDGLLTINGDTTITGLLSITGDTTITGLLAVDGPTTISGTLDIEGVTTLKNDLNVTTGGEINVGSNMTLTPSADGGSILFQDGSKVTSAGGVARMVGAGSGAEVRTSLNAAQFQLGSTVMGIDSAGDWFMQGAGTTFMSIGSTASLTGALSISGNFTAPGLEIINDKVKIVAPYTGNMQPNVHMDANGYLYRTSWTPA